MPKVLLGIVCFLVIVSAALFAIQDRSESERPRANAQDERTKWISKFRDSLEHTEPGKSPSGWTALETNGADKLAKWWIVADQNGGRRLRVVTENTGHTYNLFFRESDYAAVLRLEVYLRAVSGKEDQGGGLVWRAQDENNYYITRWNPLENNLRIYTVKDGERTQLHSIAFDLDPKGSYHLIVDHVGDLITVRMAGVEMHLIDRTFASGGKVGLWTKADAVTEFQRFAVLEK